MKSIANIFLCLSLLLCFESPANAFLEEMPFECEIQSASHLFPEFNVLGVLKNGKIVLNKDLTYSEAKKMIEKYYFEGMCSNQFYDSFYPRSKASFQLNENKECKEVTSASWFISDSVCPQGHRTLPKNACSGVPPSDSVPCCESHTLDCPM